MYLLHLKSYFLGCFCCFLCIAFVIFVLVSFKLISEYLDQILPQKEMKEVFSVRLHTENLYFCLRQKLNEIQATKMRNIYNSIFEQIHQNTRAYPRSKKICIERGLGKHHSILQTKQSEVQLNKCGLFWIQFCSLGGGVSPGKLCNFYSHLSLESLNCYINMNISFS